MSENEKRGVDNHCSDPEELLARIEKAYKIYRMSEIFLKDVADDYGKQKIARMRLDFARHELLGLFEEARERGIKLGEKEGLIHLLFPGSQM